MKNAIQKECSTVSVAVSGIGLVNLQAGLCLEHFMVLKKGTEALFFNPWHYVIGPRVAWWWPSSDIIAHRFDGSDRSEGYFILHKESVWNFPTCSAAASILLVLLLFCTAKSLISA